MTGPTSPAYRLEALNIAGGVIAVVMMALLWFALWALIFRAVPESNRDALMVVIGILSSNVGQVINFFFGSSSTNKRQTETIDTLAKTAQTAGVVAGVSPEALVVPPGQSATATATEAGTVIERNDQPAGGA